MAPARRGRALPGGALLALEVVWFRFLQLFMFGTSADVRGDAGGGAAGDRAPAAWPRARGCGRWTAAASLAAGAGALAPALARRLSYAALRRGPAAPTGFDVLEPIVDAGLALPLMLPTCAAFRACSSRCSARPSSASTAPTRARAGLLTLANTLGACGRRARRGFVLLPALGVRALALRARRRCTASWRSLALAPAASAPRRVLWPAAAAVLRSCCSLLFPFGLMANPLPAAGRALSSDPRAERRSAVREGRQRDHARTCAATPRASRCYYRLVTNGLSMSGTTSVGRRYMKLYVYWPLAVHPRTRDARC